MSTSATFQPCENREWRKLRPLRVLIAAVAILAFMGPAALARTPRPRWRLRPGRLHFGHVKTGTTAQKSFIIKNTGKVTLTGTVGGLTGPGAAYFTIISGSGPFSLAPGQTREVTVQFRPIKHGPAGAASLTLTSNVSTSARALRLAGAGQGPTVPLAQASATPTPAPILPVGPTAFSGQILIAGGVDAFGGPMATADLYNVTAGAFDCSGLGGVNPTTGACNNTMNQARSRATTVALQNGRILVAGGNAAGVTCLNSAELYNPATGAFTLTGSMTDAHCFSVGAAVLQDGEVLITGGEDQTGNVIATADLYDPSSGTFGCSKLGGIDPNTGYCKNTMTDARFLHTATLLQNGEVLIVGGNDGNGMVATAELFDPTTGTFGCGGLGGVDPNTGFCLNTMSDSREFHTAILLTTGPNAGDVLIAGGIDNAGNVLQTAELYDPSAGTFDCVGGVSSKPPVCNNSMTHPRYLDTATLLDPAYVSGANAGSVLIAGGEDGTGKVLNTAELYNPATGTFSLTGNMITGRAMQAAQLITKGPYTGYVLVAGGIDDAGNTLKSAELYNPSTGQFMATGSMTQGRSSMAGATVP